MSIAERLAGIRRRIQEACASAERSPSEVTLIAISKNHPLEALLEAYESGQRHFGESRLQEALPKIEAMPRDVTWHFIGKLQSNKVRRVCEVFHVLHTLESESQLQELAKVERQLDTLVEVNLGEEPQKSGILPENLDVFHKLLLNLPASRFCGLMTIGPIEDDAEKSRGLFRELSRLNREIDGKWLSMGMSDDFEVAIQEGSTHVRVGTAIFGSRTI